jgi:hypothetical protein
MPLTTRVRPFPLLQNILPLKYNARILPYLHTKRSPVQSNQKRTERMMEMEMAPIRGSLPHLPTYQQFQTVTTAWTLTGRTVVQVKTTVASQRRIAIRKVHRTRQRIVGWKNAMAMGHLPAHPPDILCQHQDLTNRYPSLALLKSIRGLANLRDLHIQDDHHQET